MIKIKGSRGERMGLTAFGLSASLAGLGVTRGFVARPFGPHFVRGDSLRESLNLGFGSNSRPANKKMPLP